MFAQPQLHPQPPQVALEDIGKVLVETFATQQSSPENVASVVVPPWLADLSRPLGVIDGTRGMDAYSTPLTSDQVHSDLRSRVEVYSSVASSHSAATPEWSTTIQRAQ